MLPSLKLLRADEKLKKRADEKFKTIMKLLRFIIIIILMMHGSDAECSDLYPNQRTRFRCSACCSTSEHRKHPSLALVHRVLGPLSSTNTIPMLGYMTTAIFKWPSISTKSFNTDLFTSFWHADCLNLL